MNADITAIDSHFPLQDYRQGQKEVIQRILECFNEGSRFVLLEGPTGCGKSAIGYTLAQFARNAYYLAPQKFLQDQITADFGENGRCLGGHVPMIDLKGRNAYPCVFYDMMLEKELTTEKRAEYQNKQAKHFGCDRGECKSRGESKLPECVESCPYFIQLHKAMNAQICLMNFHSFLFQSSIVPNFHKRELLIIDEAHVSEDVLLKFIELRISDRSLISKGIYFPKLETVEQYIEYLEEINLEEIIREQINLARFEDRPKDEDEWMSLQIKYGIMTDSDPSRWICQWEEVSSKASRTISLKPIFVDDFAEKYLFNMANHVLLMSATILSRTAMCDALGMDRDTTKMIKLPCFFPVENRPINFRPSGYMSYNEKAKTLPKLAKDVDSLCRFHSNERGIIHTHNFEICQYLLEHCSIDVSSRFLYQRHMDFDGDKNALLERHKSSTNTVIIAPAMHEGLDLKDDLGKFQIICKVPYPSKGDPQISARMEVSKEYYDWRTACKLVQSTGRIIRHENDSGVTYVLDEDFRRFFNRAKNILPSWWRESVIW